MHSVLGFAVLIDLNQDNWVEIGKNIWMLLF